MRANASYGLPDSREIVDFVGAGGRRFGTALSTAGREPGNAEQVFEEALSTYADQRIQRWNAARLALEGVSRELLNGNLSPREARDALHRIATNYGAEYHVSGYESSWVSDTRFYPEAELNDEEQGGADMLFGLVSLDIDIDRLMQALDQEISESEQPPPTPSSARPTENASASDSASE